MTLDELREDWDANEARLAVLAAKREEDDQAWKERWEAQKAARDMRVAGETEAERIHRLFPPAKTAHTIRAPGSSQILVVDDDTGTAEYCTMLSDGTIMKAEEVWNGYDYSGE